ncbi:I78 family peptidase inhibitor [Pseudoxanthomonas suwonensis]|uniref:Proteinase inhibitor I78 n=1 Tax=Pseudoxanthomonas suwonensis TaxID=314722 RepID=A0A0E3Z1H2_9GAMM|nr:I78 family peptidase inhibitor [Pseudoxanthomonas suwonensis]AKC86769.1 hypothetical protein WQ53_08365 [Pseudoxanthomonas suwonensis]
MPVRTLRLLPSLVLLSALCACSAEVAPGEDDGIEQEQALTDAQQAAESAATPPADGIADAPPPAPTCDASQVQGLVGQSNDEAKAEQARVDAGASHVRVLEPGQMVTMEFDGERLNIEVDDGGRIIALRCG